MKHRELFSLEEAGKIFCDGSQLSLTESRLREYGIRDIPRSTTNPFIRREGIVRINTELNLVRPEQILLFDEVHIVVVTWSQALLMAMHEKTPKRTVLHEASYGAALEQILWKPEIDVIFIDTDTTGTKRDKKTERNIWEVARSKGDPVYGFTRTQDPPSEDFIRTLWQRLREIAYDRAVELMHTQTIAATS